MRHWFRKKDGRPRSVGTLFDDAVVMLEERVMLDAVPTVTVVGAQGGTPTAATQNVLLKSPSGSFTATFEFSNTSGDNTVGYGPYIELVVPKTGADGVASAHADDDGITFNSATYLGASVTAVVNTTFDAAGHATNTLTGDVVNGTPGDQFVVLQLPFGSYTPPQTPADIVATFTLSDHADLGVALPIKARAGFEFGHSPTGNPTTDHIVNATFGTMDSITPTLMSVTKTSNAPNNKEEEVGTGPNQTLTYTINVDVAEGQTLTNIDVTDLLPAEAHFLGATVTAGTGTITSTPVVTAADVGVDTTGGHNSLVAHFNSVTGTASTADAQVQVTFYVAKTTFAGANVIDPNTGATTVTSNQASATATWHPIDPLDSDTTFSAMSNVDVIQNQPIVIQKTAAIVTDTGPTGLSPGDTVEYTLNVQVSDYFTVGNISLNDVLTDGQRLDTSFIPTLSVVERGVTLTSGSMAGVTVGASAPGDFTMGNEFTGNFSSAFNATTGATTNTIDISAALAGHPGFLGVAGVLSGGRVVSNATGTTLQLKFRTLVQNNFDADTLGAADRAVDQGDSVGNNVILSGSIRDNVTGTSILNAAAPIDDASTDLSIAKGALTKSIYAINGDTDLSHFTVNGQIQMKAGDLITYRLQYTLPITSFENLFLNDFLPLPVLVARSLTLNTGAPTFTEGEFAYGPNDTYHTVAGASTPGETFDAAGNSVKFSYPNYSLQNNSPPNANTTVDLVFTLKVQDTAFADGLFLTNLATSNESNTVGNANNTNGIVQIQLAQPDLLIQKAIVSATAGSVTNAQSVAGLTFGTAGTATSFTDTSGPLTDARLGLTAPKDSKAAPKIDSNWIGLDAGDTARIALVINNEGGNDAFDVKFGDVLPTGVVFAGAGGLVDGAGGNLVVRRGDGTVLTAGVDYNVTTNTATGFQITLANNFTGHSNSGIGKDGAADGSDILVVTYDVKLADSVIISTTALSSNASVNNFAAMAGGTDISLTDPTDAATMGMAGPSVQKTLVSTSDSSTTGAALTPGETATYNVTYTFTEGTFTNVKLSDLLPHSATAGRYEFVSATVSSIGGNLKQADGTTAVDTAYLGNVVFTDTDGDGFADTAVFGGAGGVTIVNAADNITNASDHLVVQFVVRAVAHVDNTNGDSGLNTGRLTYGASGTNVSATAAIGIALPELAVTKTLTTAQPIDASDTITFTIDVRHGAGSTANAYDLNFSDLLPSGLTPVTVTIASAGDTNTTLTSSNFEISGQTIRFVAGTQGIFDLAKGDFFKLTVTATVSTSAQAGATYTNTATVTYSTADNGNVTPGTDIAGERTGITASGSAGVTIPVLFTKSFSPDPLTPVTTSQATIGSTVTYYLIATLPEGLSTNFAFTDTLAAGLTFVSGSVVSIGGNISGSTLAVGGAPTHAGQLVTFSFGNLSDLINGTAQGAGDRIVVQINAVVSDQSLVRGATINNQGTEATDVTGQGTVTGNSNTVTTTIVDPQMTITKDVNVTTTAATGDTVQYTSTITTTNGANFANAEDVVFTDVLGGGATLTGNVVIDGVSIAVGGSGVVGGVTVNVVASGSGFSVRFGEVAKGVSHTLVYNATISAATGSTVNNNATVTYDAIDSGGASTADTQNDHNQSASDDAPLGTIGITKTITATSIADTGTAQVRAGVTDLAIGETATVQLVLNVPAGARTFTLGDLLDLNGIGRLTLAGAPTITPGAGVTFATAPVTTNPDLDGDGNPDLNIAFSMASGSAAGTITITYVATAANVAGNASGDQLNLPATLTYNSSPPSGVAGTQTASISADLVEPSLTIDKQIATSDPTPNAGDTVTYTIVVTNGGTGPAYGVTISDPLPAGLTYSGTPTLVLNMGGGTSNPASAASVTVPTLLPGQTATLTYTATIDNSAVTGVPINNTATISASGSTPGGGGRAGPNPSDSTTFTVEALQGLDKAISATSDPNTGTSAYRAGVPDLHIGEVATIDLTVRLTEGSTGTVVVTDKLQLPAGVLTLTSAPTIVASNGVTFTGTGAAGYTLTDTNGDGIPDTITMDFGTVTVPGNNVPTDNFFVIRYTGTVADVPANQAGNQLDLQAKLTTALGLTSLATAPADIVAPAVTLTKSAAAGTVSRGDTVGYTITLTNSGTGPAYDLSLADVLPAGLGYSGTTTLVVGGVTTTFASPNAVTFAMLGSGQTATVSYQVLVAPGVAPAASYTNTATVSFDSLSGPGGRAGTNSGTATIVTPTDAIGLTKTIISTTDPNTGTTQFRPGVTDLNVGEGATIDLTASFTEGTTDSVTLTDQLPLTGKFRIVGTPTITFLGGVTSTLPGTAVLVDTDGDGLADKITFNFGTVTVPIDGDPTNNLIRIRYNVVTPDVLSNTPGAALASPAMLTTAAGNAAASIAADIVAPNVTITKAVAAGGDAGDVKAYTVTIANAGTGPAYDLTIADALPAGLTAVTGTTVLTVNGVSTVFSSPAAVPLAMLGAGQSATLTFNAVVGDAVVGGTTLTNGATVSYDSLAGPGGHAGSAAATAAFTTAAVQTLDKQIVATSESFTGTDQVRPGATDLTIGERATFELSTTFSEGTTNNVVITDQLITANGVLTFTGTPTLVLGNGVVVTGGVTPVFVDTNGDGVPDQVRFNLGSVTLPGDNDPSNNFIRIRYDAVLSNLPVNVAGNQLTLPATLSSSSGTLTASAPADIVAPVLSLDKVLAPDQASDGQTTAFLLTVAHANGSTASATNVVLTEMLPPGALLAGATIVSGPAGTTINGNVITIPQLDLGQTVVIRITTSVNFSAPPTGDTINQAGIVYGTLPGTVIGGRAGSAAAQAILPFGNPTTTLPGMLGLQERNEVGSMGAYLDYRYVENFPEIDPVYSGSATPGTFVTIDVSDDSGSMSGFGTGIADAGGNWLVRLPSTTVNDKLEHSRFDRYYDGSRLFRAPNSNLFDDRSLLGFTRFGDRLSIGSQPSYTTQIVRVNMAGATDGFDPSFAPAWRDQFFSVESRLSVGGVFRDRADHAVENLYEGLAAPEAAGLNRFNREFLSTADF